MQSVYISKDSLSNYLYAGYINNFLRNELEN